MKVYYAHFKYDASTDDALYYGGSDSNFFSNYEAADECGKYTLENQDDFYDKIIGYNVYEREISDTFNPEDYE